MERPFTGIRILDFGRAVAGTYGTLILADLGAEVIKIEQVPSQVKERAEAYGAGRAPQYGLDVPPEERETAEVKKLRLRGEAHYQSLNRNKKRIALDLENEKGRGIFHDLVRKSDVVHDNFRPRMLKRLGIDYGTLKKINPRIISCSVTGFGDSGPWNDAPAYDVIMQALSGLMSVTGMPDSPPCVAGIAVADLCAGMYGALGILTALKARDQTGLGQRVDISMLDVMISLFSYQIGIYSAIGEMPGRRGSGVSGGGQVPYGGWECKDGTYLALSAGTPAHWSRFIQALGLSELEKDPRFDTLVKRQQRNEELKVIIQQKLLTKRAEEWEKIFFEAEVPVGVVNDLLQALSHPQVLYRNMVVSIEQPTGGEWKFAGNPVKLLGDQEVFRAAGSVGADTVEVLSSVLGYSPAYLNQLREMNVVWDAAWAKV